jgi:hypothetical protein
MFFDYALEFAAAQHILKGDGSFFLDKNKFWITKISSGYI